MEKVTAKNKRRVVELFVAGGPRRRAPRRLTIRQLLGHKKRGALLSAFTFAVVEGGHNVCLWNLKNLGFDYVG
jgi:hypothetical protein